MHRFEYKGKELFCEETPVSKVAAEVGTPFYLYSIQTFLDHFLKLKKAFASVETLICFSMKANSNLTVLKALVARGAGLDIVSGGELFRAKKVGVNPQRIVFASVGKTEGEITEAIRTGILFFNVESLPELDEIQLIAKNLEPIGQILKRLTKLAEELKSIESEPQELKRFLKHRRFTATEQHQLRKLLKRWEALGAEKPLRAKKLNHLKHAKDVLDFIEGRLDSIPVSLGTK